MTTRTVAPLWVQMAFHPLFTCCHAVGQVKARVQPSTARVPVLVTSTDPTKPLPQSEVSANRTAQLLVAGLPVTKVTGGEDQDAAPAASRATTVTV